MNSSLDHIDPDEAYPKRQRRARSKDTCERTLVLLLPPHHPASPLSLPPTYPPALPPSCPFAPSSRLPRPPC
jgi:hypothetical protein